MKNRYKRNIHKTKKRSKTKRKTRRKTKKLRSKVKKAVIIDVPFSDNISKGTKATMGNIEYHYQNYSNIMDFLTNIKKSNLCFYKNKNAFLNINLDDISSGIFSNDSNYFHKSLNKCLKSKYRFIPIILNLITNEGNHANILLIDKENKLIELYEPHGYRTSSSILGGLEGAYKLKVRELNKFFKFIPRYTVKNIVDYQKGTEFQMKNDPDDHSGFCVTWSILFCHYRILNPDIDLKYLMKYLSKKITERKILQYAKHIEETLK